MMKTIHLVKRLPRQKLTNIPVQAARGLQIHNFNFQENPLAACENSLGVYSGDETGLHLIQWSSYQKLKFACSIIMGVQLLDGHCN
jgi:hypothetical protein